MVEYSSVVDTEVSIHTIWMSNKTESLYNSSRISFNEERNGSVLISSLSISELALSDSDVYTCVGVIVPVDQESSTSAVIRSDSSAEHTLTVCKS